MYDNLLGVLISRNLNFDFIDVGSDRNEKSVSNLMTDDYQSAKSRSKSVLSKYLWAIHYSVIIEFVFVLATQHKDDPRPVVIRSWMQRSKSQTEMNKTPGLYSKL